MPKTGFLFELVDAEQSGERDATLKWKKIICLDENRNEKGYLIFTEPDPAGDNEIYIYELFVQPAHRCQGVASALLEHIKELCDEKYHDLQINAYITPLETGVNLKNLIFLYLKTGFYVKLVSTNEAAGKYKCTREK